MLYNTSIHFIIQKIASYACIVAVYGGIFHCGACRMENLQGVSPCYPFKSNIDTKVALLYRVEDTLH